MESVEQLFIDQLEQFRARAKDLSINENWAETIQVHESDLTQQMNSLVTNAREKEIDKLQLLT